MGRSVRVRASTRGLRGAGAHRAAACPGCGREALCQRRDHLSGRGQISQNRSAVDRAVAEKEQRARRGPSRLAILLLLVGASAAAALWFVPLLQVEPARERLALSEVAPADR